MANYAKIANELLTHLEVMDEKKCDCCGHVRESLVRFTNESIAGKTDMHEALSKAIYNASDEVTSDYAYLFARESLQLIADREVETEEELRELDCEMEPEIWFNKLWTFGSQNPECVNNCFPEADPTRGIEGALTWAYHESQRDVFSFIADLVVEVNETRNDVEPDPTKKYLCPNCDKEVSIHPKSLGQEYFAECNECDEDFFSIELTEVDK